MLNEHRRVSRQALSNEGLVGDLLARGRPYDAVDLAGIGYDLSPIEGVDVHGRRNESGNLEKCGISDGCAGNLMVPDPIAGKSDANNDMIREHGGEGLYRHQLTESMTT